MLLNLLSRKTLFLLAARYICAASVMLTAGFAQAAVTWRISVGGGATEGNGASTRPAASADGLVVRDLGDVNQQ